MKATVFLDRHYPDEFVEDVARTFLHRRLLALADAAKDGTYSDEEIKALFARFK